MENRQRHIAGTLGKSKPIDTMVKTGKLSMNAIKGKWESFLIQVVDNPPEIVDVNTPSRTEHGAKKLSGVIHRQRLSSF